MPVETEFFRLDAEAQRQKLLEMNDGQVDCALRGPLRGFLIDVECRMTEGARGYDTIHLLIDAAGQERSGRTGGQFFLDHQNMEATTITVAARRNGLGTSDLNHRLQNPAVLAFRALPTKGMAAGKGCDAQSLKRFHNSRHQRLAAEIFQKNPRKVPRLP